MVLKDRIFKFFFNLFNFFCFFIVVFVTVVNAKYHVVAHDDMFVNFINIKSGFLSNFIFDIYHGRYISNALMKLNSGIIFDIHPITWMRTYGAIIKGFFIFFTLFLLTKSVFFLNLLS